jgi:spermidine synthase
LWNKFSGSGVESFFGKIRTLNPRRLLGGIIGCGLILLIVIFFMRAVHRSQDKNGVFVKMLMKFTAGFLIATTGFCGIALEIVLIFIFQGLYGYIYSMMGLIVAVFMLGLVLGASSGQMMAESGRFVFWFSMVLIEVLLIVCAVAIPNLSLVASIISESEVMMKVFEVVIYIAVGVVGWAVGAGFPLANKLYYESGCSVRTSAAITDAADNLGAAVGAVAIGVVLIPLLGIASSCMVVAAVKCLALSCLLAAFLFVPRHLE